MSRIRAKDRIGQIFGNLTITDVFRDGKRSYAKCSCICGTVDYITRIDSLTKGVTTTCGCYDRSSNSGMRKHGKYKERVYKIWHSMKTRILGEEHESYKNYGGRGLTLQKEWESFDNFYKDMGEPPTNMHSIDRIDVTKGYSKDNCRWATCSIQAKNQGKRESESSTSKYKGVCLDKRYLGCWIVTVTKDYTTVRTQTNKDEVLAAKYFNFLTKYLYDDIVELNDVDTLSLTLEQCELLHHKIESKFYYCTDTNSYVPIKQNKQEKQYV